MDEQRIKQAEKNFKNYLEQGLIKKLSFQEIIYQRAMEIEMAKQGLKFQREMEMEVFYDGQKVGTRRADFFVEDKVMVELKAVSLLEEVHLAQAINYLEASNMEVGLLINFGTKSLEFRRLIHTPRHK